MSVRLLPPDLQKKSENELNEVPSRIKEDLKHIRDWLEKQPHLTARTDDQWLLNFLRVCKFSHQKTKDKLDMYYTMRTLIPEFFSNRDPLLPEIQEVLKLGFFLPLPKLADSTGPRVIYSRCEPYDSKMSFINIIKTTLMILDILLNEDDFFIISGQQGLLDYKGLSFNLVLQMTPSLVKKGVICLQNGYPTRPQGFYYVNTPSIFETIINIAKPLLNEKLRSRIHVDSGNNLDNLSKVFPKSILPKDYGGKSDSLYELTVYWKTKVESYRDWFLEDAKYCSNENLRPGKSYTSDEMFGLEGSFRELDID